VAALCEIDRVLRAIVGEPRNGMVLALPQSGNRPIKQTTTRIVRVGVNVNLKLALILLAVTVTWPRALAKKFSSMTANRQS
jgi:hypothetical protein